MPNKTEKPTPKRLLDSAKKGQSFKSRDFIIACLILCGIVYLMSFTSLVEFMEPFKRVLAEGFKQNMKSYALSVIWLGMGIFLPVFLLSVISSALPTLVQSGFILASDALKLNLSALNPVNGFKKMFSLRVLKDLIKSLLYLIFFTAAVQVFWSKNQVLLFSQPNGNSIMLVAVWREIILSLVLMCLGCIVAVLLLDAIAEYFLFMKDMKMDKEEVKREMKEQDGNPQIKSRRREMHMDILSSQVKSDIKGSRLIIANPSHIAIGIYFKPEILPLPFISVREVNQRALAVRAYAEKVGIPIIVDVKLARRIFSTHNRYDIVSLGVVDEVLRLLLWLEQVENSSIGEVNLITEENNDTSGR
ncbi:EscU/YscU/HrcU family type III secretion system export apparatus switch protein [Yokenella regensburgei]|uniref:EscU/YscU/HrcU family type III secretion system export apparatus switch protein n=1 Tax=Yokenella regensburgei TaxID=158877 RepID=UPI001432C738|nr:EscU/YscU/HrcU family type III secretion system export apparatus switch protein [Yokenella regensburgei]QIU92573.1 EscU/YscU/HrcU family type III secretion system export apparatus switch protein [Yokenella regensburgei]